MKNIRWDIENEIDQLILEIKNPRNDGYVTDGIKQQLRRIRGKIEHALEEYNPCVTPTYDTIKAQEEFLETKKFY